MDHELLHNDRGDYDLRLKAKKDKDKNEPGQQLAIEIMCWCPLLLGCFQPQSSSQ